MISPFSRSFRLWERLVPGTGTGPASQPQSVDSNVVPGFDVFANRPGEFLFRTHTSQLVAAGATGSFDIDGPASGRIALVIALIVGHNGAGSRNMQVRLRRAAGNADPWGAFDEASTAIATWDVVAVGANGSRLVMLPLLAFRNFVTITFDSAIAAETFGATMYWVDAPGELVQLQSLTQMFAVR